MTLLDTIRQLLVGVTTAQLDATSSEVRLALEKARCALFDAHDHQRSTQGPGVSA